MRAWGAMGSMLYTHNVLSEEAQKSVKKMKNEKVKKEWKVVDSRGAWKLEDN